MKILIYEASGGFSSYTYRLCNALSKFPEDIDLSYMTIKNNDEIHELNSEIKLLPVLKDYNKTKKNSLLWLINRIYISMYNIVQRNMHCKREKYDIISVQFTIPVIDRYFIKNLCKRGHVYYTAHDVIPPNRSKFWSMKSLKEIYDCVPSIIVHTNRNKEQLQNEFNIPKEKIAVIHHGMETHFHKIEKKECLQKLGITNEFDLILLFYGSIREQKGLDDLLFALIGIDNVHLIIAGSLPYGESFDKYERIIQENNISVTKMIEYIPFEMTDYLFQACDAVCLPYKYFYSQSGVFMQAIQYRKPVIASDVSSFGEYISKYNIGLLCEPNNSDDLRYKILKMTKRNYKEDFLVGLEQAAKENSWLESAKKHFELFIQG